MNEILAQIRTLGVLPVVTIEEAADAAKLGEALIKGRLPCAEITFRTAAAGDAIRALSTSYPEMLVGAGTVLTVSQAQIALNAGAKFIVTPGFDADVVDWCIEKGMPIVPGVMTPTEINTALKKGLKVLKFFPAEAAGGIKSLKAISGPYVGVKFIPTGGISPTNLREYLSSPIILACGGSWLVKKDLIRAGDFQTITRLSKEAVAMIKEVRT